MKDYFTYTSTIEGMPETSFRISPSQISRFFDDTTNWYREMLLSEAPTFTGSTASNLGTCVHVAAAMYFDSKAVTTSAIETYISSILDPEIDKSVIRSQYKVMAETLISGYCSTARISDSELYLWHPLSSTTLVGGSIDAYSKTRFCLTDYKTMSSLDNARVPKTFPRTYYFQQMAYVYMLRKRGYRVDYAELVYVSRANTGRISETTGKPMKDYPSEVNVVRHEITDEDMTIIENTLNLIAESVDLWNSNPELRYILAKDYRLKGKPKPTLFI